jgi:lipopolysaccharide export system protein LptA
VLTGRDIDLRYGSDGQTIQHAFVNADAVIQLAGESGQPGRQITANVIDVSIGPDGATIGGLSARDNLKLTLPAEASGVARVIEANTLESTGDPKKGLDAAHFTGNVRFDERGPKVARAARSGALDVTVGPGFSSIDDARFSRAVRFADDPLFATAALARYSIERGTLDLSGSEPGSLRPHVVDDRLVVDASTVSVKLEGPIVTAEGQVKSLLQPKKAGAKDDDTRLPSMLKDDQPVNVTAGRLEYQGTSEQASYTGTAQLWQGETLVKGSTIQLDTKKGDLVADGPAMTVSLLEQEDKNGKKEKVRSTGTAGYFKYEDKDRRATYIGDAHLIGPQGDMTSPKIELYLKESGDELERVEAYEAVTLRGNGRKTTGVRLTYFGDDNRYVVVGAPVTIVDDCGGETTGRTLTVYWTTDWFVVDGRDVHGNEQVRTQSTGKSNCPGT